VRVCTGPTPDTGQAVVNIGIAIAAAAATQPLHQACANRLQRPEIAWVRDHVLKVLKNRPVAGFKGGPRQRPRRASSRRRPCPWGP
jgi:hypothetical protein